MLFLSKNKYLCKILKVNNICNLMKSKILTFFIGSIFLLGCGGDEPANTNVNLNANIANANTNANANAADALPEKLFVSGVGVTLIEDCKGREIEFDEDSTGNDYTFRGECKNLTVNGVANKVSVEKVGEITVAGVSNKVVYVSGLDGKKPKINKSGKDTSVDTKEIAEKNKKQKEQKEAEEEAKAKKAANQNGL